LHELKVQRIMYGLGRNGPR